MDENEKKELKIFFIVTFGFTVLMGIFMGISYHNHRNVTVAVLTQMLYPMTGVILTVLYNRKNDEQIPKNFFYGFLAVAGVMSVCSISIAFSSHKIWGSLANNYLYVVGSLACLGFYLAEERKNINHYKLRIGEAPLKMWVKYSLLFFAILFLRSRIQEGLEIVLGIKDTVEINNDISMKEIFSTLIISIAVLIPSFFEQFIFFLGEEYGWRGFLQPLLQKRFGMRKGIFILGVIWGIWHLPVSMFKYSPDKWYIQIISQIFLCIFYSIFFGYVYLKTKSIWLVAWVHYINNFIAASLSSGTVQQTIDWKMLLSFIITGMVCYLPFLKSKVFTDKSVLEEITLD